MMDKDELRTAMLSTIGTLESGDGNNIDESKFDDRFQVKEFDKLYSKVDSDGSGFLSKQEFS